MFLQEKQKEWNYLNALRAKGKTYIELLEAVKEMQSLGEFACFHGYPTIEPNCNNFKVEGGARCNHTQCLSLWHNHRYYDKKEAYEESNIPVYKAQTALLCEKIKE